MSSEDDLYRTSSQYRLWSFSPDELASLRAATHSAAVTRAQTYVSDANARSTPCLTLSDETRLVQRYAEQIRTTSDFFKWPINVKATAVQYLKRFYLTNSVLTYPPKEIYKSVLFLASKTEGVHMTLGEYARRIKTAKEDVLAPEYKIIQSLRFTLDVRQPFRGLRGALMELLNIIEGQGAPLPFALATPEQLRDAVATLPPPLSPPDTPSSYRSQWTPSASLADRANAAYTSARQTLDSPALLTDVYFLFTPPQIYLAALLLADMPLAEFYLATKLDPSDATVVTQIRDTVGACVEMLIAFGREPIMSKEERAELEKRLDTWRDPGTKDLVGMHSAAKMDGMGGEDAEEKARKKAEKAEERKRADDVFGPAL